MKKQFFLSNFEKRGKENGKNNDNNSYFSDNCDSTGRNKTHNNLLRLRSNSICHTQANDKIMVNRANEFSEKNKSNLFITSTKKLKNTNHRKPPNLRASSTTSCFFKRKFLPKGTPKIRKNEAFPKHQNFYIMKKYPVLP